MSQSLGISPLNRGAKEKTIKLLNQLQSAQNSPSPPHSPYKLGKIKSQARMLNSPTQKQSQIAGAIFPILPQQRIISHTPHPRALSIPENRNQSFKKRKTKFEPQPGQLAIISQSQKIEKKVSLKKLNLDLLNDKVIIPKKSNIEGKQKEQVNTPRSSDISPKLNKVPSSIERNLQSNSITHLRSSRNKARSQKRRVPKLKSQKSTLQIHMNIHEQSLFSNDRSKKYSRMPSMESFSTHAKVSRRDSQLDKHCRTQGDSIPRVLPKLEFLQEYNMGNASHRSDELSSVRMRNKVYTLIDPGSSQPNI